MKYRILTAFVMLTALLCICITANASTYDYTISLGDNFISVKSGDNMDTIAQKLDMTTAEFNSYFKQNGLVFFAISDDTKSQIKISTFSNNFSSEVGDISTLDEKGLLEFAKSFSTEPESTSTIVSNNGRKFILVKCNHENNGSIYTTTQYITIFDNKTFYITGYNDGESTSDEITSAFKSFNLIENTDTPTNYSWYITLTIAGVVIFSALAIIMVVQIVRSHLKEKKEQQYES